MGLKNRNDWFGLRVAYVLSAWGWTAIQLFVTNLHVHIWDTLSGWGLFLENQTQKGFKDGDVRSAKDPLLKPRRLRALDKTKEESTFLFINCLPEGCLNEMWQLSFAFIEKPWQESSPFFRSKPISCGIDNWRNMSPLPLKPFNSMRWRRLNTVKWNHSALL